MISIPSNLKIVVHVRWLYQQWVCLEKDMYVSCLPHAGDAILIPGIKFRGEDSPRSVTYLLIRAVDCDDQAPCRDEYKARAVLKHEDYTYEEGFLARLQEYKDAGFSVMSQSPKEAEHTE